jgi:acyl-CoA thioester hydrolase
VIERSLFRHGFRLRVRSYEIDWQGIVHNANYLLYFEAGRVAYLEQLGLKLDVGSVRNESAVVVVRNEVDYDSPARFGEELNVWTRISTIRNSSFIFEGFIEEAATQRLVARNISVHVWLEHEGGRPIRVPEEFRGKVAGFEGDRVQLLSGTEGE